VVIKVKAPRGSLAEDIVYHAKALVTGFKEVVEPNRLTIQYPREVRWVPERFRGWILLDIRKCISCLQCAWACPVNAIQMYRAPVSGTRALGTRSAYSVTSALMHVPWVR